MKKIKLPLPKNKYARIFVKSILITFSILLILAIALIILANIFYNKIYISSPEPITQTTIAIPTEDPDTIPDPDGEICKNILLFGVDKGASRTDTIMLVHFNSETSQVAVVSIPRDTKVSWSSEQQDIALELGCPYNYTGKITDMSSMGGIENLRYFTIATIEEMLNIRVDNYIVIDTQMLREVVDSIGGVEVDVPRVMEYRDDYQDLTINLQPGLQTLNGEQAEGLLRWRNNKNYTEQYALGDLGRIETQQLFVKAFAKKVLSIKSLKQLTGIITSAYKNVTTDIALAEAISYLSYLNEISLENIRFKTLPGETVQEDLSYYIVDEQEARDYISLIFTDNTDALLNQSNISSDDTLSNNE